MVDMPLKPNQTKPNQTKPRPEMVALIGFHLMVKKNSYTI